MRGVLLSLMDIVQSILSHFSEGKFCTATDEPSRVPLGESASLVKYGCKKNRPIPVLHQNGHF